MTYSISNLPSIMHQHLFAFLKRLTLGLFFIGIVILISPQKAWAINANIPALVKDINTGSGSTKIKFPTIETSDGTIYFFVYGAFGGGNDGLYKSDGTASGTVRVKQLTTDVVRNVAVLGNKIIFSYEEASTGRELWVSDGTTLGTHIIEDLYVGTSSGVSIVTADNSHDHMLAFNGYVYFGGTTADHTSNLYRTDGVTIEKIKQTAVSPLGVNSAPHHFVIFNNRLFFTASSYQPSPNQYRQIWSTDGTDLGTKVTIPINGMGFRSNQYNLSGREQPFFKVFKNQLCFQAYWWTIFTGQRDRELGCAKYDSATDEYILTKYNINPLVQANTTMGSIPKLVAVTDSLLFLVADDNTHGQELWAFAGEVGDEPYLVKDINVGSGANYTGGTGIIVPEDFFAQANGIVIFRANDGSSNDLWKTDGTLAGTTKIKVFDYANGVKGGESQAGIHIHHLAAFNGLVYFSAQTLPFSSGDSGIHLWQTNGKTTRRVTEKLAEPIHLSAHGNSLYMMAKVSTFSAPEYPTAIGYELFKLSYRPYELLTRRDMAQEILIAKLGSDYVPPVAITSVYTDVLIGDVKADWILDLAARGFTEGCAINKYCPDMMVTKEQMAKVFAKSRELVPPPSSPDFDDVLNGDFAWESISLMRDEGATEGCISTGSNFCPRKSVAREWFMRVLNYFP